MDRTKLLEDQREMIQFLETRLLQCKQNGSMWRQNFIDTMRELDSWRLVISAMIVQNKTMALAIPRRAFRQLEGMKNVSIVKEDVTGSPHIVFKMIEKQKKEPDPMLKLLS